jgi:hypothetical protein
VLNADRTASSVDGSLPPDPTLRISGGYSKISGGSTEMTGDPSDISSDQWSLNLVTKVWTKLSTPEYSEADARDMATTRADHALIVLGESMTVMTGGQCRTLERCKENFILAQPLGPDPRSELLTNVTLGVHPVTYMHNSQSKMVNKAVMAGAHVYVFSFGDYDSFQGFRGQSRRGLHLEVQTRGARQERRAGGGQQRRRTWIPGHALSLAELRRQPRPGAGGCSHDWLTRGRRQRRSGHRRSIHG